MQVPRQNLAPPRLDHGEAFARTGIADIQPPGRGQPFETRVPMPDSDGIDRGGIRLPSIAVPLGTYLGWNLRLATSTVAARPGRWEGSFLPFPLTEDAAKDAYDPRPSIAQRYHDKERFLADTRQAADNLVGRRLLLPRDVPAIMAQAGRAYDAIRDRPNDESCGYLAAWN